MPEREHRSPALFVLLLSLSLAGCPTPPPPGGGVPDDDDAADDDDSEIPDDALFDAHIHFVGSDEPSELVAELQAEQVVGAIVLGGTDPSELWDDFPDFGYGYIFQPSWASLDEDDVAAIAATLDAGAFGVGEMSIRHFATGNGSAVDIAADEEALMAIYALSGERGKSVNIHFDFVSGEMASFETALSANTGTTFVWAHAGDAQPGDVEPLMAAHDNLWIDISCRNHFYPRWSSTGQSEELQAITDDKGVLEASWRGLFEAYPDRVVWGSDIGPGNRREQLPEVTADIVQTLNQLDPEVSLRIRVTNARRLLGLD